MTRKPHALITGANGSVGRAITEALIEAGYRVALLFRSDKHKAELQQYGPAAQLYQVDVSDAGAAKRTVAQIKQDFGTIDLVVNALGGWLGGKALHEHGEEDLDQMLHMDLIPTFYLLKHILPILQSQGHGKVINFASQSVFAPEARSAVYAASKAGVLALSQAAAAEYRASGIEVYVLAPGTIDTAANRRAMPDADRSSWVSLEELSQTILFIARHSKALSGTVLHFKG